MKIFKLKNILIQSLIIFSAILGYYVLVSNGLGHTPFYLQFRRFIPMSVLLVITYNILKAYLPQKYIISFSVTGLLWLLVYPIFFKITNSANMPFFSNHFDIVFAVYSFIGLTSLTVFLSKILPAKLNTLFITAIQFILIVIPVFQIIYFIQYGTCISEAAVMAIFQTNPTEAKEYLLMNIGYLGIFCTCLFLIVLFSSIYKFNLPQLTYLKNNQIFDKLSVKVKAFIITAAFAATGYSFYDSLPQAGFMQLTINVKNYFSALNRFNEYHIANYQNLVVEKPQQSFSRPSTIIMVIGESASRKYMSAFSDTKNNTTPWLLEQKHNPNFLLFPNAYTSWVQTVPALERALTEKNQYNTKEFNKSITVIDIAKKAGYHTYWFSNQGTIDEADTPITLVGKTADTYNWTNEDVITSQYDGTLLNYLKTIDPAKNNFIVLHFMGSHADFQNRYPKGFAKWGTPGKNEPTLHYDNSLYYSDYVLSEIYNYAKANLNLQAMVYFSDHGCIPDRKRHPDKNPFAMNRIPLFVYLSDEYKATYPETAAALTANKDKYFTNDLIYDMMCGIFNIKSPNYDETQSIASPKYKFTRETLRTNLGKTPLIEDSE